MRIECNYCGCKRLPEDLNRVKVSAGPDLYFCIVMCTEEVVAKLSK